ncbi:hypothetical protein ATCC90586_008057 [Pythium insidiosum]|nr:hypothetical protein ATCC90586_008057 [Pythium insidiosum]
MQLHSLVAGLAVTAVVAFDATSAACTQLPPVFPVPTNFGLDKCLGNNLVTIIGALGATPKCQLPQVLELARSPSIKALAGLASKAMADPGRISTVLYEHMAATDDAQMDAFCADWSKLISPCTEALVPLFMRLSSADFECCGQLGDLFDQISMFLPPNIDKASFLLTDVVDGVNHGTGSFSRDLPLELNAGNLYNYVRWNVNLLATDSLESSMLAPQVWSWAENEPAATPADAAVFMQSSGRWVRSTTLPKNRKACFNAGSLEWSVVAFSDACPSGFAFVGPPDADTGANHTGHHGPSHDRPSHHGPSHHGPTHDDAGYDGPSHHGPSHHGPSHHGSGHHGPSHHGSGHHGPSHHGSGHHDSGHHGPSHHGPSHHGPSHHGPSHHGPSHHGPTHDDAGYNGPGHNDSCYDASVAALPR